MLSCGAVTKVYSTERGDVEAVKGIDLTGAAADNSLPSSGARARASRRCWR